MTQIKPPFLHLWTSVLSLCRLDDLSSWADFAKALLKFPAACCNCSRHTLFIPFFHTLRRPHPVSLSCLFTRPLMGRGLPLQRVFRCVYVSLLICERAPLFFATRSVFQRSYWNGCFPDDGSHFSGVTLYDFSSWTKLLKETTTDTNVWEAATLKEQTSRFQEKEKSGGEMLLIGSSVWGKWGDLWITSTWEMVGFYGNFLGNVSNLSCCVASCRLFIHD